MSNPVYQTNNNANNPAPLQSAAAITVTANSHAVIRSGDNSLWDSVSNVYVATEKTNAPTPNNP